MSDTPNKPLEVREPVVGYVHTQGFAALLQQLGISLIVSTYQAQRIVVFTSNGTKLSGLMRTFERPTGMAIDRQRQRIALCAKNRIWFFHDAGTVFQPDGTPLPHDAYFVPRYAHITGDIAAHELHFQQDQLLVVNTRFSCLCTLSQDWSFVPTWRPPFIDACVAEDRCHLNGLVCDAQGPKIVTALGATNTKEGWRDNKAKGGVVIDVPSGEIVVRDLAMPHSPRAYAEKYWVLESGSGTLRVLDLARGQSTPVLTLPGYLRGLAFHDRYAFIGTCKIREKSTFGGMPIEERVKELKCSIQVVDILRGEVVEFLEFTKGIEELFDIKVLVGLTRPQILGFEDDTVNGVYVVPP